MTTTESFEMNFNEIKLLFVDYKKKPFNCTLDVTLICVSISLFIYISITKYANKKKTKKHE